MDPEDLKEITRGMWNKIRKNLRIPNKEMEKKYEDRYKICLECPIISDDYQKCSKEKGGCGCPLDVRLRSNKGCPKGYWQ